MVIVDSVLGVPQPSFLTYVDVCVCVCVQGAERGLPTADGDCGLCAGCARDPGLHRGEGLLCAISA